MSNWTIMYYEIEHIGMISINLLEMTDYSKIISYNEYTTHKNTIKWKRCKINRHYEKSKYINE